MPVKNRFYIDDPMFSSKKGFRIFLFVFLLIFLFSTNTKAEIKNNTFKDPIEIKKEKERLFVRIDKNSTKPQLQQLKKELREKHKLRITFNKLNFNKAGELTDIDLSVKTRGGRSKEFFYPMKDKNPIHPLFIEWDKKNKEEPLFIDMIDNEDLLKIQQEIATHQYIAVAGEKSKIEDLQHHLYQYRSMRLYEDKEESFFVINGLKSGEGYTLFSTIRKLTKEGSEGNYLFFEKKKDKKQTQLYFITVNKDPKKPSTVSGFLGGQTFSSSNRREVALVKTWLIGEENIEQTEKSTDSVPRKIEEVEPDRYPIYPGCEKHQKPKKQRACLSQKANQLVSNNIKTSLVDFHLQNSQNSRTYFYADFVFDEKGALKDIITLAPTQYLTDELLRILKLFPTTQPAMNDGKAIRVSFTLPLIIGQ